MAAHVISSWTRWVGYAAATWCAAYALLGLFWTLGGAGFPFGAEHDPDPGMDKGLSILAAVHQQSAAPVIAVLGFAGTAAALMMARGRGNAVTVGFVWALAAVLALIIQDYRPLVAVGHLLVLPVIKLFGLAKGVSLASQVPWPVINLLICVLGGLLLAATAVAYQRRSRGACDSCGRTDDTTGWTTPERAAQWGTWAAWFAAAVPLLYALTRWAWFLGIPLGFTADELRDMNDEMPGIWLAGALLSSFAIGGSVLTLGLVQRWGEVFPRWMPFVRGRRVPIRLAVIPAATVAVLVTASGLMVVRDLITHPKHGDWATRGPGALWPLWGFALAAAALAYYYRRRGTCKRCGQGPALQEPSVAPTRAHAE